MNSSKMNRKKVERLIEIVRGHVLLYDLSHKEYKNTSLKAAIWDSIGQELNETGDTVRNKWRTVRDGYTKYRKQLNNSEGSSKKNIYYTWASQLEFLNNTNAQRSSSSNVTQDPIEPFPQTQTPTLDFDNLQYSSSPNQSPIPSASSPSQIIPLSQVMLSELPVNTYTTPTDSYHNNKCSSQKRRIDSDDNGVLQMSHTKKKKEYDVTDYLFLSYADTFKRFPPREQAVIKLELAKLFSNTELELLNNNSNDSHFKHPSIKSPAYSSSDEDQTQYSSNP